MAYQRTKQLKDMQGWELNTSLQAIKQQYNIGAMERQQAQDAVQPILDEMNRRGSMLAKKHGKRHAPISFSYVMR